MAIISITDIMSYDMIHLIFSTNKLIGPNKLCGLKEESRYITYFRGAKVGNSRICSIYPS